MITSPAGFYCDHKNQRVQHLRPGPIGLLVNDPKSQVYGAEAEVSSRVIPDLTVNGSLGYLHTTYKELTLQQTDDSGNELRFGPQRTLQGSFDWMIAHIGDGAIVLTPSRGSELLK